jgi:2-aminomuconate deaminase
MAANGRDMTATEVAQSVGINLPTVHRFLLTLEEEGVVTRTQGGRFNLGHALAELGGRVEGDVLLIDAARPHLDALAAEFREAVHCATRSGNQAANAAVALPDRSLVTSQPVGAPFPLHCTAVGKVFLANMSPSHRQDFLENSELRRFTAKTITDPRALDRELESVLEKGYAVEEEEWEEGLRSVAVPLHSGKGKVVAAIALSAPISRFSDEVLAHASQELKSRVAQMERSLFTETRTFSSKARPRGNFPHLKRVENFIYISGTSARRPDDTFEGASESEDGTVTIDIRKQAQYVFESMADMLKNVGASLSDLVEVQAFLLDMADYEAFNEVYARFFSPDGPARTTVAVRQLPHRHQGLMIRAVAYRPRAALKAT